MIRRPRRTLPAVVTALLVLTACGAVIVSLVQRLVGAREFVSYESVAARLHSISWCDLPVLVVGVVAAALGMLLLALAMLPGRPVVLALTAEEGMRAGITRGGLRTVLNRTAAAHPGVESARIQLRRNAVKVSVRTDRSSTTGLAEEVGGAIARRVQDLGPARLRRVRTTLRDGHSKAKTARTEAAI